MTDAEKIRQLTEEIIAQGPRACKEFLQAAGIINEPPPQSDYEKVIAEYLGYKHFTEIETDLADLAKFAERYFKNVDSLR